ncbi:MAG: hypothetical protein AAFV53_31600, partial [Myxococcota bacterium]
LIGITPIDHVASGADQDEVLKPIRGGHLTANREMCRSSLRMVRNSGLPMNKLGFRLLRTPTPHSGDHR